MIVPAAVIAQHARDLRACSLRAELQDWIALAAEQAIGNTPEAEIAGVIHSRLFELDRRLEPVIERLAVREAEREAQVEAEIAAYEREAM